MAAKTVKMTAPTGASVTVDASKVEGLLGRGFTQSGDAEKTTAKKAAAKKSSK